MPHAHPKRSPNTGTDTRKIGSTAQKTMDKSQIVKNGKRAENFKSPIQKCPSANEIRREEIIAQLKILATDSPQSRALYAEANAKAKAQTEAIAKARKERIAKYDEQAKSLRAEHEESQKRQNIYGLLEASRILKRHRAMFNQVTRTGLWGEKLEQLKKKIGSGMLYGLIGPRGTGKSQLATNLIIHSCHQLRSAKYTRALDMFSNIRTSYQPNGPPEYEIIRKYTWPSLLIIDELQERSESTFESMMLTNIIDKRYGYQLDTLLLSNLTKAEFEDSLGSSIVSRMRECGGIIVCDWPSFRNKRSITA